MEVTQGTTHESTVRIKERTEAETSQILAQHSHGAQGYVGGHSLSGKHQLAHLHPTDILIL